MSVDLDDAMAQLESQWHTDNRIAEIRRALHAAGPVSRRQLLPGVSLCTVCQNWREQRGKA